MRPRERQETGEQDLFRSRLDRIIDLTHALVKLSRAIGGFWRRSSDRSIRMAPAARRCRRG
jgi:IS5 family transposase